MRGVLLLVFAAVRGEGGGQERVVHPPSGGRLRERLEAFYKAHSRRGVRDIEGIAKWYQTVETEQDLNRALRSEFGADLSTFEQAKNKRINLMDSGNPMVIEREMARLRTEASYHYNQSHRAVGRRRAEAVVDGPIRRPRLREFQPGRLELRNGTIEQIMKDSVQRYNTTKLSTPFEMALSDGLVPYERSVLETQKGKIAKDELLKHFNDDLQFFDDNFFRRYRKLLGIHPSGVGGPLNTTLYHSLFEPEKLKPHAHPLTRQPLCSHLRNLTTRSSYLYIQNRKVYVPARVMRVIRKPLGDIGTERNRFGATEAMRHILMEDRAEEVRVRVLRPKPRCVASQWERNHFSDEFCEKINRFSPLNLINEKAIEDLVIRANEISRYPYPYVPTSVMRILSHSVIAAKYQLEGSGYHPFAVCGIGELDVAGWLAFVKRLKRIERKGGNESYCTKGIEAILRAGDPDISSLEVAASTRYALRVSSILSKLYRMRDYREDKSGGSWQLQLPTEWQTKNPIRNLARAKTKHLLTKGSPFHPSRPKVINNDYPHKPEIALYPPNLIDLGWIGVDPAEAASGIEKRVFDYCGGSIESPIYQNTLDRIWWVLAHRRLGKRLRKDVLRGWVDPYTMVDLARNGSLLTYTGLHRRFNLDNHTDEAMFSFYAQMLPNGRGSEFGSNIAYRSAYGNVYADMVSSDRALYESREDRRRVRRLAKLLMPGRWGSG
mmetsp:Transcript_15686/g.24837  ORF Transcript_15686/g.24837 Transcript_15686/m.24837 type:complete len:719 (-) Transcript_15686:98-2254(-)